MTRQQVLDLYFMDARSKLLDIAAFLDRVDRGDGAPDFRLDGFRAALKALDAKGARAEKVLLSLSDLSKEPIAAATTKAATGACPPAVAAKSKAKATTKPKAANRKN